MILVNAHVAGRPKTKGSMVQRPNGSMRESVIGSPTWRALMAGAVKDAYALAWASRNCWTAPGLCSHPKYLVCGRPEPYPGAVFVIAAYWLPVDPITRGAGDLDKLARNTLDAIAANAKNSKYNGGVIMDDNLVVKLNLDKFGPAEHPAAQITVHTLDLRNDHVGYRPAAPSPL